VFEVDEKIIEFLTNGETIKDLVVDGEEYQANLESDKEQPTETKFHTMSKVVVNL